MNLLEKANTITTPTAYSNGFLHSVKPEVVENLLVQSNQFDTTWANSNTTENGGQADKDGGTDAWLLTKTAANGNISQSVTSTGVQTFSIYAKANTTDWVFLNFSGIASSGAYFDLANGVTGTIQGNVINAEIESSTNGYYRISITASGTASIAVIYVADANNTISGTSGSIYIQDAQLNKGLTAYPYLETTTEAKPSADFSFTRNSSATRVNELGYIEDVQIIGGELVSNGDFEEIGSELVTNGSFDTDSDWDKLNATITDGKGNLDGDGQTSLLWQDILTQDKFYKVTFTVSDYNGLGTAKVIENTGATIYDITSNGTFTVIFKHSDVSGNFLFRARTGAVFSIDNVSVKEVGQNWTFGTGWTMGDGKAVCDGTNAVTVSQDNVTIIGKKYRITYEIKDYVSGTVRYRAGLVNGIVNSGNGIYTEDIVVNSTVFSIQSLTFVGSIDNISVKEVTDDTNLPRINYEGFTYENGLPVPYSGKGHLLLEGQRTNLLNYSEDFTNAYWSSTTDVILEGGYLAPDGSNNAYKVTKNGSSAKVAVVVGGTAPYSKSIYARTLNGTGTAYFGEGEISGNGVLSTVTEQWQRFEISVVDGNFYAVDFRGASTLTEVLIWGAQMENNATYATSYIPTNGTAVTRLGETCNNATQSFPSEGVLYAEIAALADDGTDRRLNISDGTFNNRIFISYTTTSNQIVFYVFSSSLAVLSAAFILNDVTEFNKVALRYKDNDFSAWVNGVQVAIDTSGNAPTGLSQLQFASSNGTSAPFYSKTKMIATFPYLSNDEMECLTGEGYGTFEALAAAYSYTIK